MRTDLEHRLARLAARIDELAGEVAQLRAQLANDQSRPAYKRPAAFHRPSSTAVAVLAALQDLGGAATIAQLREYLPTRAHSSIRRTCQELRDAGRLRHTDYGVYELATPA